MSVKTSTAASPCPQCGCALFPCPSCAQLLKDGTVLCVSCGYHLQLGRHVGASANGSHGIKPGAPHGNGHDPKGHAPPASNTQDYIASLLGGQLLGGHAASLPESPAGKLPTAAAHVGNMAGSTAVGHGPVGKLPALQRTSKLKWPGWLTFSKGSAAGPAAYAPQTFAHPQPGMPPQPVSKPVIRVAAPVKESVETDASLYSLPTILLVIGLAGIGWFAWSGGGIPGLVIGSSLLLGVLLVGTLWNAVVMHLAGWLLEFDFGPLGLGLYRLFAHSVFTVGLSLATVPLAKLTGAPLGLWALLAPVVSFVAFSILFDLEWFDTMVVYGVFVFITALFQFFAFGLLHTANYIQYKSVAPQEVEAPRQGDRSSGEEDDGDAVSEPVRAGAADIRNPEPAAPAKDPESATSEPAKADAPEEESPKKAPPAKNITAPSDDN